MRTNWQNKKLGEIAKIRAGYGFPKDIQGKISGDFPFIKVGDMNYQRQEVYLGISENYLDHADLKENGYKIIPAGTIIFPKIGGAIATNKKRILAVDSLYDNNVMGIIPTEIVSSEYLYYWLSTKNLSDWASGTSLPAINKTTVESEEIPLPPLTTQRQIVAILDEKFNKLREAKRLREEAIRDTENILWATLREIFEDGKSKGWEEGSFKDLVDSKDKNAIKPGPFGSSLKKEFYVEDGYKIYGQEQVISGDVNVGDYYINDEKYKTLESFKIKMGDILISLVGTIGRVLIIPPSYKPGIINPRLLKISPDPKKANPYFIKYLLGSSIIINQLCQNSHGGTMNILNKRLLLALKIPLPPIVEQNKIVEQLDKLSAKIKDVIKLQEAQLADLKKLEKAYLREAFRGELF